MSTTKFILLSIFLLCGCCFAASFQDVANQKKGSGEDVDLFFRPQFSTSSNTEQTTAPKKNTDAQQSQPKATEPQGKWATSIRGVLKN